MKLNMLYVYLNPFNIFWWRLCIFPAIINYIYLSVLNSSYSHSSWIFLIACLPACLFDCLSRMSSSQRVNAVQLCTFRLSLSLSSHLQQIKQQKFQNFWQVYAAAAVEFWWCREMQRKVSLPRSEWERKSVNIKWIVPVRAKRVWDILFITRFRHVNGISYIGALRSHMLHPFSLLYSPPINRSCFVN